MPSLQKPYFLTYYKKLKFLPTYQVQKFDCTYLPTREKKTKSNCIN